MVQRAKHTQFQKYSARPSTVKNSSVANRNPASGLPLYVIIHIKPYSFWVSHSSGTTFLAPCTATCWNGYSNYYKGFVL